MYSKVEQGRTKRAKEKRIVAGRKKVGGRTSLWRLESKTQHGELPVKQVFIILSKVKQGREAFVILSKVKKTREKHLSYIKSKIREKYL